LSDSEKKSGGEEPELTGRTFGKYRIINDDEMPLLRKEGPAEEAERELRKRASYDLERDTESVERRRTPIQPMDPSREADDRPRRREPLASDRLRRDLEESDEKNMRPREAAGQASLRRPFREPTRPAGIPRPKEPAEPIGRPRGPNEQTERVDGSRKGKDSRGRKGSCPSWLKSRVYKGRRPTKDDNGLQELQELIIRKSPIGTAVLDNRGRVRIRNESFMEAIELDVDDSLEDIEEIAARVEGVNLSDRFWDAVETGSTVEVEEEVVVGDETKTTVHISFAPVSLPSGMSWCICYFETTSRQASRGGIFEYQNYVAHLATSSADAIVGLDKDGAIKYWNQGAQALFGYTDDEIVGKNVMILIPEELRREAQLVLKVVQEKGLYRNFDTHRVDKFGDRIPVTMTVSAIRDGSGKFIGSAANCKDLRTAKDLHEKALEAEKLNAVLQMAVSVYHQINNPLCVIAANAQLLLPKFTGDDKEGIKKIDSILDATKRINTCLEDLTRLTGVEPRMATTDKEEEPAA
jgi:PAS domain S-box-containing protein